VEEAAARLPIVVIDSVGFVRMAINPDGPWGAVRALHRTHFEIVLSDQLVFEIVEVLSRSKIKRKFSPFSPSAQAIQDMLVHGTRVELPWIPQVCRDPKDDMVVATAVFGHADFIATEDKDLLDMGSYQRIRMVTGPEFLRELRGE
jgi:putative PIN family toxin of toxin-antitoxin system